MKISISGTEWKIFKILIESDKPLSVEQIISESGIDQTMVAATLMYGQEKGWLTIQENLREELILSEDARLQVAQGLPERKILPLLAAKGKLTMHELAEISRERSIPMNEVIKWGSIREWLKKEKDELVITEEGRNAINNLDSDEKAIKLALEQERIFLDELAKNDIDPLRVEKLLRNRHSIAKIKERKIRLAIMTEDGRKLLTQQIEILKEQNILTSEDIITERWRAIKLRPYDVKLESDRVYPVKIYPMQKIIQQTRRAFLEMGFTEIVSSQVESSFWDFDALFQPQDHPARDMQDTFYLSQPSKAKLPDEKVVERVKLTHENGWETGSKGWGYKWDIEKATQVVLRTHTTASSIRALSENPDPPQKVFCVGKVYRNESISYKHLPEFFQVEGIIVDENANFVTLLGTLKEFYKKMGFEKVKFKPSFFPYTEPSAEIFVYMESKERWIELGGAGIFRPEVTKPFGCHVPVLAWGLGLERLAMNRYAIDDIRELYWSDLDKIKEILLCQ